MTRNGTLMARQAVEAAADLALSRSPEAPGATPINDLCRQAGIGTARFYRIFTDLDNFRVSVAEHYIRTSYATAHRVVDESAGGDPESDDAPAEEESVPRISALATGFRRGRSHDAPSPEGGYLQWLDWDRIRSAVVESVDGWVEAHHEDLGALAAEDGRTVDPELGTTELLRLEMVLSMAADLVPVSESWTTTDGDDVPGLVNAHVAVFDALTTPATDPEAG